MDSDWTADRLLESAREYQRACVVVAAAELDLVEPLSSNAMDGEQLSRALGTDPRATAVLADALTSMGLLVKEGGKYRPASGVAQLLDERIEGNVIAMLRHHANCLRSWAQLAEVVRSGRQYDRPASVRGAAEDRRSFIEAMEVVSREAAPKVVQSLGALPYSHLLDIGGGPGTWTRAFLEANPSMRATLYDLPEVLPLAHRHFERHGLLDRVELVEGDFYVDAELPKSADLVWVSAITHQNSRQENRDLYTKIHRALLPGGAILIRDIVMSEDHVAPPAGAMFAINMLVNTEGGGTYSVTEQRADLESAGFTDLLFRESTREMDWILEARRP